jgi:DNA polymerase-1
MACGSPNLQQIPRDPAYRACIRPATGRVLVKADFSQVELRIAAQITGDKALRVAYQEGADVHVRTAAAVLGVAPDAVTKEQRQIAKVLNFGLVYGMGAARLRENAAQKFGVQLTEHEAADFRARFFRAYPGLKRWHQTRPDSAIDTRTLAGRRRLAVSAFTEKLNSPVQGTGADLLKLTLAYLWEDRQAQPSAVPANVVHDEIVLECDANAAPGVAAWLVAHMERAGRVVLRDVPIVADVEVMVDWSGAPISGDPA